ncbi:flagellar biosynthetic protein FliR [Vulgatibacter sp.]|uniref:flagellar biosynthetic protein FliR n=1 Tax=Vulgatibacter sp. TaxID=1971226 RepID=UPI003563973A
MQDVLGAPLLYGFGLVLFRSAGLIAAVPVLGAGTIPVTVRMALALVAAAAAFAGAGMPAVALPDHLVAIAGAAIAETVVGLAAGLAARLVLEAAQAAGQVAGLSVGLGYGALVDPVGGASTTALGQLFAMGALAFAVALGLHREAFAWLTRSAIAFPPGSSIDVRSLAGAVVVHGLAGTALAVRLAFPILAAVTCGHLALGLLGRIAPQLNLASIGFSIAIFAGGAALYLVLPAAADAAARAALVAIRSG